MSLQAHTSRTPAGILVLHLSGSLTVWPDGEICLPFIDEITGKHEKRVVLDLSELRSIDSSGMQVILSSHSAVQSAGGELRVASASVTVARLFRITQLDSIITFYPTVDAACQDFPASASMSG